MTDPHAMPAHPTVNKPDSHRAHNKPNATQHHAGTKQPVPQAMGPGMAPGAPGNMAPPPGMFNDHDADDNY